SACAPDAPPVPLTCSEVSVPRLTTYGPGFRGLPENPPSPCSSGRRRREPAPAPAVSCRVSTPPDSPAAADDRRSTLASAARPVAAMAWIAAVGGRVVVAGAWRLRADPQHAGPLEGAAVFGALLARSFALHIGLAAGGLVVVALLIRRWRLAVV